MYNPPTPKDLFSIPCTSGTMGVSKGAMITHKNIVSMLASISTNTSIISVLKPTFFQSVPRVINKVAAMLRSYSVDSPGIVGTDVTNILRVTFSVSFQEGYGQTKSMGLGCATMYNDIL
ncbi:12822_t:CDS:2 [Funneliformis geosporum]|uniref:12822_t:CDS:1 n=1 Tax=Funneliformis geosporum TaxID=1117311 RepID=A0A9W4WWT5_9GLOM|nr:12822_t:CDS:2 [Funneliformis geosporum]